MAVKGTRKRESDRFITVSRTLWVDRFVLTIDIDKCIGCELCRKACPKEAIALMKRTTNRAEDKFHGRRSIPLVDEEKCSMCGLCTAFCPTNAVSLVKKNSLLGTEEEIVPILDVGGIPHFSKGMVLNTSLCPPGCSECAEVCPREALTVEGGFVKLDRARCLSCSHCEDACPVSGAITVTPLFDGEIEVDTDKCPVGCDQCVKACPTKCYKSMSNRGVTVDPRYCICCGACFVACFYGAIDLTRMKLRSSNDGYSAVWSRAVDLLLSENARFLRQSEGGLSRVTDMLKKSRL